MGAYESTTVLPPVHVGDIHYVVLGNPGALSPYTNARRVELLKERQFTNRSTRFNFTYAAEGGRVYTLGGADVEHRTLDGVVVERKGKDANYPTYFVSARASMTRVLATGRCSPA